MLDIDTFVTILFVVVDDYCQQHPGASTPGPAGHLAPSELITLALLGQWGRFSSERDFYRFASERLRSAFPLLPERSRYNRLVREQTTTITAMALEMAERLGAVASTYQAVDCSAIVVRDRHRRGNGWFVGDADIGYSNRLGWFEGFRLLIAVDPRGVISGFCFAAASVNDRHLAEGLFAARNDRRIGLASAGQPVDGTYLLDKGFNGPKWHNRWRDAYHAYVICAPQKHVKLPWPPSLRRWLASHRQIVETVFDKIENVFGLRQRRLHTLAGIHATVAAKAALHNFCMWLNRQLDRPDLAFVDLLGWT
jgi:hypothetical protein